MVEFWVFVLGIYLFDLGNIDFYFKYKKVGLIEYILILSISNIGNKILFYFIDLIENEEDNL